MMIWNKQVKHLIISKYVSCKEMSISGKEFTESNYQRFQKALVYIKNI